MLWLLSSKWDNLSVHLPPLLHKAQVCLGTESGNNIWTAVFWTFHSCCPQQLWFLYKSYTRTWQPQLQHKQKRGFKTPFLAEGKEIHSSLRMWLQLSCPWASGWHRIHVHTGALIRINRLLIKEESMKWRERDGSIRPKGSWREKWMGNMIPFHHIMYEIIKN